MSDVVRNPKTDFLQRGSYEARTLIIHIYNATIQNNHEIDRVHKYELYIATVSIKHKSVDRIKTALQLWLNATR